MKRLWLVRGFILCLFLLPACSGQRTPTLSPTIVVDEACQGIINFAFISTASYLLGEDETGPVYGPYLISFLQDGRVVWKYGLEAHIGTFTCQGGVFTATFSEGDKRSLSGTYAAETDMVHIEEVNYLKEDEE